VPFTFQLVSRQVDITCDRILGWDFLRKTRAKICYETGTLTFRHKETEVRKRLLSGVEGGELIEQHCRVGTITLPRRSAVTVKLPVAVGTSVTEGLHMAGSVEGHVLTSRGRATGG
jgi:hypothetical protein